MLIDMLKVRVRRTIEKSDLEGQFHEYNPLDWATPGSLDAFSSVSVSSLPESWIHS